MEKKKIKLIHCPNCNRTFTYYRIKTDDFVCRNCGIKFFKDSKPKK